MRGFFLQINTFFYKFILLNDAFRGFFLNNCIGGGMVQMKLIRNRRNGYALLFSVSICLVVWFGMAFMLELVFVFGATSLISLMLLVRQSRLLNDAILIWDNPILAVSSAHIFMPARQIEKDTEETVVSTFGILMGSEIYRWGLDGVHGVRLHAAQIDTERMYLTFGDAAHSMRVELLHGMTQKQAVLDAAQKLLHETGVKADITGW
jgi:hypothetical protein